MNHHSSIGFALAGTAAIACTSARGSLLLIALASLTALLAAAVRAVLLWLQLPHAPYLSMLFSAAVGGSAYWCFRAFLGGDALGAPLLPLIVCALCGALDERTVTVPQIFRLCAALAVIGAARELLIGGTLFAYPLTASPLGETTVSGLLVAGAALWLFRFCTPTQRLSLRFSVIWQWGLISAAACVLSLSLPHLSVVWRFWLCLLLTLALMLFSPHRPPAWLLLVPPAVASSLNGAAPLWQAIVAGGTVTVGLLVVCAVSGRLSRSPRGGLTLPSLLCLIAVLLTAI